MSELRGSPHMTTEVGRIGPRFLAYFVDQVIAFTPIIIFSCVAVVALGAYGDRSASPMARFLIALAGLVGLSWSLLYTLVRDGLGQGQSLGKRMVGLMVVRLEDGRPCTIGNSIVRNLIGSLLGIIDIIIVALFNQNGQRVGDMLLKTQVVAASNRLSRRISSSENSAPTIAAVNMRNRGTAHDLTSSGLYILKSIVFVTIISVSLGLFLYVNHNYHWFDTCIARASDVYWCANYTTEVIRQVQIWGPLGAGVGFILGLFGLATD